MQKNNQTTNQNNTQKQSDSKKQMQLQLLQLEELDGVTGSGQLSNI